MGRVRFVTTEIERLPISDGDWIEVKRDLNTGEQKKLEGAGLRPPVMIDGKPLQLIDWERYELERAAIFLMDWSLRDANDKPAPLKSPNGEVSMDVLKALDPESFEEINTAIFDFVLKRSKEKKALRADQLKVLTPPVEEPTLS